jgi:hypothetical protein
MICLGLRDLEMFTIYFRASIVKLLHDCHDLISCRNFINLISLDQYKNKKVYT